MTGGWFYYMPVGMAGGRASLALFVIAVAAAVVVGVVLRRRRAPASEDPGPTGSDAEVETRGDVLANVETRGDVGASGHSITGPTGPSGLAGPASGIRKQALTPVQTVAKAAEKTARPDVFTPPREYVHMADRQMGSEVPFVHKNRAELTTTTVDAMQLSADSPFDCFGRCTELTACRAFSMRSTAVVDGAEFLRGPRHLCVYYGEAVNAESMDERDPGQDTYIHDVFVKREAEEALLAADAEVPVQEFAQVADTGASPPLATQLADQASALEDERSMDVEQKDETQSDAPQASAQATVAAVLESAAATKARVDEIVAQALASTTDELVEPIVIDHSQALKERLKASKAEVAELLAELDTDDDAQTLRREEQSVEQQRSTTAQVTWLEAKLAAAKDAQESQPRPKTVSVQDGDADAVTAGNTCGYEERVSKDFAVGNGLWNRVGSVEDCKVACDAREDCLGFSRVTGDDRTCWFKGYNNSTWIDANSNVVGYKKRATCSDDTTAPSAADADAASSTDTLLSMSSNVADRDTNLPATPKGYTRLTNRTPTNLMINKYDKSKLTGTWDDSWRGSTNNLSDCFKKCSELNQCHAVAVRSEDKGGVRAPTYLCSYRGEISGLDDTNVYAPGYRGKIRDLYIKRN